MVSADTRIRPIDFFADGVTPAPLPSSMGRWQRRPELVSEMSEPIQFRASFPAIQGAIRRSGDAGGMRIQLDIPESEMANAAFLLAMVQQRLIITVEVDDDSNNGTGTPKRKPPPQRVR